MSEGLKEGICDGCVHSNFSDDGEFEGCDEGVYEDKESPLVCDDIKSPFEFYADIIKERYDYVAVCREKHGDEGLFHIVFDNEENLRDFMRRNDGDCHRIGFYAEAYANGEFLFENT